VVIALNMEEVLPKLSNGVSQTGGSEKHFRLLVMDKQFPDAWDSTFQAQKLLGFCLVQPLCSSRWPQVVLQNCINIEKRSFSMLETREK